LSSSWPSACRWLLAFLAANIIGAWVFMGGERGISALLNNGWGALTTFALVPIPLFLLMGEVFFQTGLGSRMFNAIDRLLGKLPGRLSYVTVLGGTGFSTLSGSSMGSTALLGSLMVPEMKARGYKKPHVDRADPGDRRARRSSSRPRRWRFFWRRSPRSTSARCWWPASFPG
jgi:TRAP-type mannitol/chloroaromatic compound transport system permease large subunit